MSVLLSCIRASPRACAEAHTRKRRSAQCLTRWLSCLLQLLPSAEQAEKQWNAQIAAMQDSQLAQNKDVLNNVGAEHWKAQAVQLPPWKPTVVLPVPKSGEFKGAMRHHEQTGGHALDLHNMDLPETESYEQKNAETLARYAHAQGTRQAAFFGLEKDHEQPAYKNQRPQQLLQTQAFVQGQQLAAPQVLKV